MIITCSYCGCDCEKSTGHINRALKSSLKMYCDRICAGLGRRTNKTEQEKKLEKKLYDQKYSEKNSVRIKKRMKEYYESQAGRAVQKRNREKFKQCHLEYCRTPEYRAWKKEYDKKHRAKKQYGEFWESGILVKEISEFVDNREAVKDKGTINKTQKRKRQYEKFKREKLETSTLGNPK